VKHSEKVSTQYAQGVIQATKRWKEMHDVYYGKDRDVVNFPIQKMAEYMPKVRMGVLPDNWFQAFYNKTGVTGPYLFLWGGLTFLISKEIWIVDHQFVEIFPFVLVVLGILYRFGPKANAFFNKYQEEVNHNLYHKRINGLKKAAEDVLDNIAKTTSIKDAVRAVFQAKRENLEFQLQAAHRERFEQVHKAVKSRLEYHIERDSARRQFQHQHMLNWIMLNVMKSITPQQEKEALQQCIQDLKSLSAKVAHA